MINSFGDARSLAVSYIGISHKSSGKVRDYLIRKDVSAEVSEQVVASLTDDGYLDDLRIARSVIQARSGRKAEGRIALQQRMSQAGISRDVISESCEFMPEDEISILELFDKKLMPDLQKQIGLDTFNAEIWMNKSFRFLLSRGYSTSLAIETLRKRIHDVK